MRKFTWIYGLLAGIISSLGFLLMAPAQGETINFDRSESMGYAAMLLGFVGILIAITQYRAKHYRNISFAKAFKIGLFISLIASLIYCATWEYYYQNYASDFAEQYMAYQRETMSEEGMTEVEINQSLAAQEDFFEAYKNNLAIRMGVTSLEILPVGLVITLLAALLFGVLLRKSKDEESEYI